MANNFMNNRIFVGPPGSGKTYSFKYEVVNTNCNIMDEEERNKENSRYYNPQNFCEEAFLYVERNYYPKIRLASLHEGMDTSDLIEGLLVETNDGVTTFVNSDKMVLNLLEEMKKDDKPGFLILDDIHRVNIVGVLGELLFAFSHRGETVTLSTGRKICVPENLYVYFTMNTLRPDFPIDSSIFEGFQIAYMNSDLNRLDKAVNEVIGILKNQGTQVFISGGNDGRDVFLGSDYEYSPLENVESGVMGNLALTNDAITVGNSSTYGDITNVYAYTEKRTIPIDDKIQNSVTSNEMGDIFENTFEKEYSFHDFISDNDTYEYIIVPNYGNKEDYKGIDVKGKIAVVDRGVLPFSAKIYYALESGASGLLIANGSGEEQVGAFDFEITDDILKEYPDLSYVLKDGVKYFDTSLIDIPVATISYESGVYLKENENKTLSFGEEAISLSSSMGNGIGLELKPDIVAPGSNVFGALSYDAMNNEYVDNAHYCISGTSMASPNLMGAYSTILSNYQNLDDVERDKNANIASKKMLSNTTLLLDEYGSYLIVPVPLPRFFYFPQKRLFVAFLRLLPRWERQKITVSAFFNAEGNMQIKLHFFHFSPFFPAKRFSPAVCFLPA